MTAVAVSELPLVGLTRRPTGAARPTATARRQLPGGPESGADADRLKAMARSANDQLEGRIAHDIIRWAADSFGGTFCVTSSMQDLVLADIAASVAPGVDVVFLDTGYHFAETLGTRNAVVATMDVRVVEARPTQTVAEQDATLGVRLHDRNPELCCQLRKVAPLSRMLAGYDAYATGVRRVESPTRAFTPVVRFDAANRVIKLAPLTSWTDDDVTDYAREHGVLSNPLLEEGYPSIGCIPCTSRVTDGEDVRSGRWAGRSKIECGLHR